MSGKHENKSERYFRDLKEKNATNDEKRGQACDTASERTVYSLTR